MLGSSRRLRSFWTWIISGQGSCLECGRPIHYAGAYRTDVCDQHYRERLSKLSDPGATINP